MSRLFLNIAIFFVVSTVTATAVQAASLKGVTFVITNTFEGAQTKGIETDVAAFGMHNNRFAVVGDGVEFPAFINIYDVDVGSNSIKFTWAKTKFSKTLHGPTADGNHDRNYFTFDLPSGVAIDSVTFDAKNSDMLKGSAQPQAKVLGPNRIVVDNAVGVIRGPGFNPAFKIKFK